jgi:hypothetical protein
MSASMIPIGITSCSATSTLAPPFSRMMLKNGGGIKWPRTGGTGH